MGCDQHRAVCWKPSGFRLPSGPLPWGEGDAHGGLRNVAAPGRDRRHGDQSPSPIGRRPEGWLNTEKKVKAPARYGVWEWSGGRTRREPRWDKLAAL